MAYIYEEKLEIHYVHFNLYCGFEKVIVTRVRFTIKILIENIFRVYLIFTASFSIGLLYSVS